MTDSAMFYHVRRHVCALKTITFWIHLRHGQQNHPCTITRNLNWYTTCMQPTEMVSEEGRSLGRVNIELNIRTHVFSSFGFCSGSFSTIETSVLVPFISPVNPPFVYEIFSVPFSDIFVHLFLCPFTCSRFTERFSVSFFSCVFKLVQSISKQSAIYVKTSPEFSQVPNSTLLFIKKVSYTYVWSMITDN